MLECKIFRQICLSVSTALFKKQLPPAERTLFSDFVGVCCFINFIVVASEAILDFSLNFLTLNRQFIQTIKFAKLSSHFLKLLKMSSSFFRLVSGVGDATCNLKSCPNAKGKT